MSNKEIQIDAFLRTIDRHWNQAIQIENQRANFTNYIIAIIGVIQGYVIQREFDGFSIFASISMIFISLFGGIITRKYYERFNDQASKVGRLIERIKELDSAINLDQLEDKAKIKHIKKHPRLINVRLHILWSIFYGFFILLGLANIIVYVFKFYYKHG